MTGPEAAGAAWRAWYEAAGDMRRWMLCLPLQGPGLQEVDLSPKLPTRVARPPAAGFRLDDLVRPNRPPTLVVLDIPPLPAVRLVTSWAKAGVARPLLVLKRWPYAQAVLPAQPLVNALIQTAFFLPQASPTPGHVALVLDGERARSLPHRPAADPRADNRSLLYPEELPTAEALLGAGMTRVIDVRSPAQAVPAPLSTLVYPAYRAAGLVVDYVTWARAGSA